MEKSFKFEIKFKDNMILEYNNEMYEVYIDKDDNQLKIANITRM